MGELILSQAGAAAGAAFLPNGLALGGLQLSGGALGGALGSLAGRAIQTALTPAVEGPRIETLHVMQAHEGAGMANVYGRMRVGGQLVWASRFREKRRERKAGKGGPKVADYTYSVSFAVAICEGQITRLDRVWANGASLALSDYNWRLYKGSDTQLPDPLIEAIEGEAPAYRGTAYIVFEDFPLDAFGNRLPQLSFEVVRAGRETDGLRQLVHGVNIIPASGEFVYGSQTVRERRFPGIERALNMNNTAGEADFVRSLDQLESDLPGVDHATLTVAWFGDDLRAGSCRIRPGVETRTRQSVPYNWDVANETRASAYLVSQSGDNANFGGTPADRAVIEGIQAMKAQGLNVTLTPFLLMDIPAGNARPDPYGGDEQAAFPWRGRITSSLDGTAAVRTDIEAFLGTDADFAYRHFILHYARLSVEAGGVETILIGSEMRGLTRLRDETGAFPFVEGLVQLAQDVKALVGPDTKVSYAADWTEYGAYVPGDGSGDVLFPLDPLWTASDIDFVGVDWYPPAGDWRESDDHLDALAGYQAADDPGYLESQMAGGEAYDWYYASQADRDAQVRTPITDTAYGEDWIFRQKDLAGWWASAHHERPGGVRVASPTGWTPGMKPVRLMEIGFPAVDKGGNAPNLFYDPKSEESALPPYSTGARNDVFQRRALEVALSHWQAEPFVEQAYVWAWDARPWPDFPARDDVWSDGPNWTLGHWLNGRTGLITLAEVMGDLAFRAGIVMDTSEASGLVEGVAFDGPMTLRRALDSFRVSEGLACQERADGLKLVTEGAGRPVALSDARLAETGPVITRPLLDKQPGRLQLSYISASGTYLPASIDARSDVGDPAYSVEARLPFVLSEARAGAIARDLLSGTDESETAELALLPEQAGLEPGDLVTCETLSGRWLVGDVVDDGLLRRVTLSRPGGAVALLASTPPEAGEPAIWAAAPELVIIDGPGLYGMTGDGPLLALTVAPWTGPVRVSAGRGPDVQSLRATITAPARIGVLAEPLAAGPLGRWDRAAELVIDLVDGDLSSVTETSVLSGENAVLVNGDDGWECLCFARADMQGEERWRLSGLLRGLRGSDPGGAPAGAVCVLVDSALVEASMSAEDIGLSLDWKAGTGTSQPFTYEARAGLPWSVAHLRARTLEDDSLAVSWFPRGPDIPDNWDLPDPVGPRIYRVEAESTGAVILSETVHEAAITLPAGCDLVRVAELGTDGREGPWVSIVPGDA